jgi:hypothetical protein
LRCYWNFILATDGSRRSRFRWHESVATLDATNTRHTLQSASVAARLDPKLQRHYAQPTPHATEAVMEGRWKLLTRDGEPLTLTDLEADLSETTNLIAQRPEIVDRFAKAARSFLDEPRDRRRHSIQ